MLDTRKSNCVLVKTEPMDQYTRSKILEDKKHHQEIMKILNNVYPDINKSPFLI